MILYIIILILFRKNQKIGTISILPQSRNYINLCLSSKYSTVNDDLGKMITTKSDIIIIVISRLSSVPS